MPQEQVASPIQAEEVERLTIEVLSRPEFETTPPEAVDDWFSRLLADLIEWAVANPAAASILKWALILGLIALLGYAFWALTREVIGDGSAVVRLPLEASPSWKTLEGRAAGWEEALAAARRSLRQGRLYEAIWMAHRALLALLDYRGALEFAPWKTNRDYVRECVRAGGGGDLLDAVSDAYETVVYAHRPVESSRVEDLLSRIDAEKTDGQG